MNVYSINPDSDLLAYWQLEDLTDSSGNGHTLTNNGATSTSSNCHEGDCFDFDGSNDYLQSTGFGYNDDTMTLSVWADRDTTSTADMLSVYSGAGGLSMLHYNNDQLWFYGTNSAFMNTLTTYSNNVMRNYVYVRSPTRIDIYVNGAFVRGGSVAWAKGTADWSIGRTGSGGNFWDGTLDDISIWNRSLSAGEISDLYSNGINITLITTPQIQLNITEGQVFDHSPISLLLTTISNVNSSVSINGSAFSPIATDSNSTIYSLIIGEGTSTLSFKSIDSIGIAHTNLTVTKDTIDPVINIFNTSTIESYSITWSNVFNYSDDYLDSCWIVVENSTENCISYTFTESGNQSVAIYVNDSAGNIASDSFYIFIDPEAYIYFETPGGSPVTDFTLDGTNYSNYASINIYDLGLGNHTLLFSKYGYEQINVSLVFNTTAQINITEIVGVSLLGIKIYDRESLTLITQNVNVDLVGDSFAGSYSTSSGILTIENITELPGLYRLSFESSGYANNEYYFTHTGFSVVNVSTYLINESLTIPIKVILRDIFQNEIDGCYIKIKQYFISENDYIQVDQGITNSNGEIIFDLEYDVYYQFVIECDGVAQTEAGQKITSTPLYLTFDDQNALTVFDDLPNIAGEVTFANLTNSTGYFRFEYNDLDNIVSEGCLRVYETEFSGDTFLDEQCTSSASATINVNINFTTNKKYVGKGYVTYNGQEHYVDQGIKTFYPGGSGWNYGVGLWSSVLLITTLFLIGMAMHPIAGVGFAWVATYAMVKFGALGIPEASVTGIGALIVGVVIFARSRQ